MQTKNAKGTFSKQETGGKNQERESYGDVPYKNESCQEWPSYSGMPKRIGNGGGKSGGSKKDY